MGLSRGVICFEATRLSSEQKLILKLHISFASLSPLLILSEHVVKVFTRITRTFCHIVAILIIVVIQVCIRENISSNGLFLLILFNLLLFSLLVALKLRSCFFFFALLDLLFLFLVSISILLLNCIFG